MQIKEALSWQRTTQAGNYVASELLDANVDTSYRFTVTDTLPDSDRPIVPAYLTVDNKRNATPVTISYGPFRSITIDEFSREVFRLPGSTIVVEAGITAGQASLYFSETPWVDPATNQYAIQQAAVPPLSIPVLAVTGSRLQASGDNASQILFSSGSVIDYTLRDLGLGVVPSGFFSFLKNIGTANVRIIPDGQNIDNHWNNANPLILKPGAEGLLTTDAGNWFFAGDVETESAEITLTAFTAAAVNTFAHGLGSEPRDFTLMLRCKTAEQNWSIGDETTFSHWRFNGGGGETPSPLSCTKDATNIVARHPIGAGQGTVLPNKTTGALFLPTSANWAVFVRARQ